MQRPGEAKLSKLFEPITFNGVELKNRIKYGACCVSNYNGRDGFISERELARMRVIARTGCSIITNQGAYPDPLGEGKAYFRQLALWDDKFLPAFETIAADIHDHGAIAIQQILHAGRYGGIDLGYCIQPSVVPQTLPHFRPPQEMDKAKIQATIKEHADAAARALKAGFDGTEITSFMGYLLANFNSKFTNRRTDEYGGSTKNRARFMCELIDAIKQVQGESPLVVRLNGTELMDRYGGNTEDECLELMQLAAEAGMDMLSVTVGWQEAPESSIGRDVPPGNWNHLAARAKELLPDMPVAFGVRLPDPVMANACIENGEFDLWEVCRPLLADPELVHKAAEDRLDEVRRCVGSMNCLSRLFRDLPYTCTMNPVLGHEVEPQYHLQPAAVAKKVMIVGAGPAGMECAIAAKKRGHDVVVFDRGDAIGGNLIDYATHDLANRDDLLSVVRHYETMARKLDIDVRLNTMDDPAFMRDVLHEYDVAVLAVGARIDIPALAGDGGATVVDALDVAAGRVTPTGTVVVIGGGKIGLTVAESLRSSGADVTLIEESKRVADDVHPTWKWRHTSWLKELKVNVMTSTRVIGLENGGVRVANGEGEAVVAADTVIASAPRRSNQELIHAFRWMVDEVHSCGDAVMPRGLDEAIHEGYLTGARI